MDLVQIPCEPCNDTSSTGMQNQQQASNRPSQGQGRQQQQMRPQQGQQMRGSHHQQQHQQQQHYGGDNGDGEDQKMIGWR